eukprot:TRINITY_DN662_c0_g1_i2.p1 TRINITY_DN662_c0_g1~~TRINITY_DN662_c0_g1_i2.p1  ORF type:complete len:442 (+),score=116.91 TRINITY_DN662_c0_g1_i2:67-1326(+)
MSNIKSNKIMNAVVLGLAASAGAVSAESIVGPGCTVSVTSTARAGSSWQSGSGVSQIYDLAVTNTGACSADAIALNLATSGGVIQERWNLDPTSRYYQVTGFESTLPVGSTVNAGVIVNFANTQTVPANGVTTTTYGVICPSECVNQQPGAGSSSDSGSASASDSGSASASGSGDASCSLDVKPNRWDSYPEPETGRNVDEYAIFIENTGDKPALSVTIGVDTLDGRWSDLEGYATVTAVRAREFVLTFKEPLPAGYAGAPLQVFYQSYEGDRVNPNIVVKSFNCGEDTESSASASDSGSSPASSDADTCDVSANTVARSNGSFQSGNGMSQIYDSVVTNNGPTGVTNIVVTASLPAGATIQSSWNLNAAAGAANSYTVTSYEGLLPSGNSVNVGFIVNFPNTQTVPSGVSLAVSTTAC